jgi:hypothetical protein
MALIMLPALSETQIVPKMKRGRTSQDVDRLNALHETVDRLVAEGRALRAQIDQAYSAHAERLEGRARKQSPEPKDGFVELGHDRSRKRRR